MLIKPYGPIIEPNKPTEEETYVGIVADNEDPKKLGRCRVFCSLYEDIDLEALPWCFPTLETFLGNSPDAIAFSVPEVGSEVRVSFPTHDKYAPYYSGCELNERNKCTFFDDDYPNCYGFKDSVGNFTKINKRTGINVYQHTSTTNVEIMNDGTTTFTTPNGQYMLGRLHARQLNREDNWQASETSKYANNALKKRYPDVYNKDKYSSVNDWADDLCDYSRGNVCFNLGDRDEENPIYSREKMNQPDSEYERRIRRDVIPKVSKFKP
jgi:hypothetical protein